VPGAREAFYLQIPKGQLERTNSDKEGQEGNIVVMLRHLLASQPWARDDWSESNASHPLSIQAPSSNATRTGRSSQQVKCHKTYPVANALFGLPALPTTFDFLSRNSHSELK
jgi:hypothetical protein